jgi:hypothetical protein
VEVTPTGSELNAASSNGDNTLGNPAPASAAESGAVAVDPDLARLIAAWPALPQAIRRVILALVESGR